jgi:hypothetical protein
VLGPEYPVSVIADTQLDRLGALANTRTLVLFGRSEYWVRESREAFDRYVDAGGDALLVCAETMLHDIRTFDGGRRCEYVRGAEWKRPGHEYPILPSVGPNFRDGGWLRNSHQYTEDWGSFKIVAESPLLGQAGIRVGDRIELPIAPHDGLPLLGYDEHGEPLVDAEKIPFARWRLLGYCFGSEAPTGKIGAFMAFQRSEASGRCVHFGSLGWTSPSGLGGSGRDSDRISKLVLGTVRAMHERAEIF